MKLLKKSYDFVIVGSNSAACVLANRLSRFPDISIAVIEAGKNAQDPLIQAPSNRVLISNDKKYTWSGLKTEPEQQLKNRQIQYMKSRVLGGSSSTNNLTYLRGREEDYREFIKLGWKYEDIQQIYKNLENNDSIYNEFHGNEGEISVNSKNIYKQDISQDFLKAAIKSGIQENGDFNGENQLGVGYFQQTLYQGERVNGYTAFLVNQISNKKNIDIYTDLQANKLNVLNDGIHSVQCKGVNGTHVRIEANKEVILCTGTINTPKLLKLSGIGEETELNSCMIKCVNKLENVGRNLVDQVVVHQRFQVNSNKVPFNFSLGNYFNMKNFKKQFKQGQKGILTSNQEEVGAFVNLNSENSNSCDGLITLQPYLVPYKQSGYGFTITSRLLHPLSKGVVEIIERDNNVNPIIWFNALNEEQDKQNLVKLIQKSQEIIKQGEMQQIITQEMDSFKSESELIEQKAIFGMNAIGSCRMGVDDKDSVVNSNFKVHNMKNLRIADSSIIPNTTSGNNSTIGYMIGQMISEKIISDHNLD